MKPPRIALYSLLSVALSCSGHVAFSQTPASPTAQTGRLIFQTGQPWSPRTNINADTVLVYGINDTTAERIRSWREHGYHVAVMTGVAWGRYAPYLRGDFDGKEHWNETQQEKNGDLRASGVLSAAQPDSDRRHRAEQLHWKLPEYGAQRSGRRQDRLHAGRA
jgi:hypothetical protein